MSVAISNKKQGLSSGAVPLLSWEGDGILIYITGDTHGEIARFKLVAPFLHAGDTLIVAGDFGCIFGRDSDDFKLAQLCQLHYTIAFIDGNHECFPKINSYPEEMWNGGKVHRIAPNIVHLMRGQVFEIEGLRIFTMGGGYSLDKGMRLPGISWWYEELPNAREYDEGQRNLERYDCCVDFIVSHAAPMKTMQLLFEKGVFNRRFHQEDELNLYLQKIEETVKYRQHYFGHLHFDMKLWHDQTALWYDLYCLNSGEKVNMEQP